MTKAQRYIRYSTRHGNTSWIGEHARRVAPKRSPSPLFTVEEIQRLLAERGADTETNDSATEG